jgi:hypothetical protein
MNRLPEAPRYLEIVVGLISAVLGVVVFAATLRSLIRSTVADFVKLGWAEGSVRIVLLFGGYSLCVVGWRLLTNRRRASDGGLLSPVMLRVGGALCFLGAVITALSSMWGVIHAVGPISIGTACFALAGYRERAAQGVGNRHRVA